MENFRFFKNLKKKNNSEINTFNFYTVFSQPNYLKTDGPSISNHFKSLSLIFNSMSNMYVTLDYLTKQHPKKAILPTFSGQKETLYLHKRQETKTNNLHQFKAGSVAFF